MPHKKSTKRSKSELARSNICEPYDLPPALTLLGGDTVQIFCRGCLKLWNQTQQLQDQGLQVGYIKNEVDNCCDGLLHVYCPICIKELE